MFFRPVLRLILCFTCLFSLKKASAQANARQTTLTVGIERNLYPLEFIDEQGRPAGFSVELTEAVAETMGLKLDWKAGTWDEVWNQLKEGEIDIVPIVAKFESRKKFIDFSLPHTETFDAFFVRETDANLPDLKSAAGKTILVMRSDSAHHILQDRKFKGTIELVETIPIGLALLSEGQGDAFLGPKLEGSLSIKAQNLKNLKVGKPVPDYKRIYSFGIKKGSDELREQLNQGLMIVKTNGVYDQIYTKWFSVADPWFRYRQALFIALNAAGLLVLVASIAVVILRNMVRKRVSELAILKEQAEAANMAKTAFLANMSHEIRTPLGAVVGFSELVADPSINSSEKVNYIAAIRRNGELLSGIINDVLDLSKIEAGKMEVSLQEVALSEILHDTKTLLSLHASEAGILLQFEVLEGTPKIIRTDPVRLRQILLNIIGNAIKFTAKGSVSLLVQPVARIYGRQSLAFIVKDTGLGILEDQIPKLFKSFSQADFTMKRKHGGSGLGLVLSKRLANLLGGDVVLDETRFGQGSQFTITIDPGPVRVESSPTIENENLKAKTLSPVKLEGVSILLAEDSPDNQVLIKRILTFTGAKVDVASNGEEAVQLARKKVYDVVLMDLQMPVLDGFEATELLRKEHYPGKIIALTAHALDSDRKKCLAMGFDDHLTKPIHRNTLFEHILKIVETNRAHSKNKDPEVTQESFEQKNLL